MKLQVKALSDTLCFRLSNTQEFVFLKNRVHTVSLNKDIIYNEFLAKLQDAERKGLLQILNPKTNTSLSQEMQEINAQETKTKPKTRRLK